MTNCDKIYHLGTFLDCGEVEVDKNLALGDQDHMGRVENIRKGPFKNLIHLRQTCSKTVPSVSQS
jgi:hypothetical protein